MPEYTFALGDVNRSPYLSWIVEADSVEQAMSICREAFADDKSLEVSADDDTCGFQGIILRADPERIGPENIIDVYEPASAERASTEPNL